jgi:PAS domain S-box-containing protein
MEPTNRENYIKYHLEEITQFWLGRSTLVGSVIFLLLGVMDYFATPVNFPRFMMYRVLISIVLLVIFFSNNLKKNINYQYALLILGVTLSATAIELMILSFGGHKSYYYVGLTVLIIAVLGFVPLNLAMSLILASIIYFIYVVPIVIFDRITEPTYFIISNAFLLSLFFIAIGGRLFNQQRILNELSLQYDLEQKKKQLETYSLQLKGMVEERTKELHESEQWHRSLFENATDGIVVLDRNGIIVNINDKACEMHGFSRDSLVGTHIGLLERDENRDKMAERMRRIFDGESLVFEAKHNMKDGTTFFLEISSKAITIGAAAYVQSFYRDITEKKKLQQHLFQSQKMESIGVLAGGIAHDFNNILTAILGHAEIIRRFTALDEKSGRSLTVIEDASRKAGRMIAKLLGFARKSKHEMTPVNLNDVVYDTVKLLEQVIDKTIRLNVELDHRLPLIQGDANQMEQVIMNFIVNARDAMPNGGRIVIKTAALTVVKGMVDVPPYVQPGEYVVLSVSDTGMGIPEEIVNKIFEPFFTTKEQGKGTGLGLSMVYGAVKDHQGYLAVQSTVGVGSVFTVYVPAAPAAAASAGQSISLSPAVGRETLLLVDDEEDVLDVMREALEGHGYRVFATSESGVALDIYRRIFPETALVITDVVMPRMDGRELIRQIKKINPAVKVLAVSGYTKYVADEEEIREIEGFLQKPFESYYLLSVVRRILDGRSKSIVASL